MKKFALIAVAAVMIMELAACSNPENSSSDATLASTAPPQPPTQTAAAVILGGREDGFSMESPDRAAGSYVRFTADNDEHHIRAFEYAITSIGKLCDAVTESYQVVKDGVPMDIHKVICDDDHVYQITSYGGSAYVKKWSGNEAVKEAVMAIEKYQSN
jgi:hypothetical protein